MTHYEAQKISQLTTEKYDKNRELRVVVLKGQQSLANYRVVIAIEPVQKPRTTNEWDVAITLMKSVWEYNNFGMTFSIDNDFYTKISLDEFQKHYRSYE